MSGASARKTMVRIVAPLLAPALIGGLIFSLIFSLSSFELEQLIGIPAGLTVFTTAIYNDVYGGLNQFGPAAALAMMLLVVTLGLIALQWKLLSNRNYQTVSGKGFRAQPMDNHIIHEGKVRRDPRNSPREAARIRLRRVESAADQCRPPILSCINSAAPAEPLREIPQWLRRPAPSGPR